MKLSVRSSTGLNELELEPGNYIIGRSRDVAFPVEDSEISRQHCMVMAEGERVQLVDLESTNGSFLNGRRVKREVLKPGDVIQVGGALILVKGDDGQEDLAGTATRRGEETSSVPTLMKTDIVGEARRRERLAQLVVCSQRLASDFDVQSLLETVLRGAADFLGTTHGLVIVNAPQAPEGVTVGLDQKLEELPEEDQGFLQSLLRTIQETRHLIHQPEPKAGPGLANRAHLAIPLTAPAHYRWAQTTQSGEPNADRESLGMVWIDSDKPIRFTESDRRLLEGLASQAGIALQNALLHGQATSDPLTGVLNRHGMARRFQSLRAQDGSRRQVPAILVDLDHFKKVNDVHGHSIGDEVLVEVAARLRNAVRNDDLVARLGGEEFVMIPVGASLNRARQIAEKARRSLSASPMSSKQLSITASFGIAVMPDVRGDLGRLLEEADQALYQAKDQGRNRVVVQAPLPRTKTRPTSIVKPRLDPEQTSVSLPPFMPQ